MEKFMMHSAKAIDFMVESWKKTLFFGTVLCFIPELVFFVEKNLEISYFTPVVSLIEPIYRLLGLGVIAYAAYIKATPDK